MSSIKDFILLIPCYNNLDGLLKSINSVQYPTDKFEILIVDDGSTPSLSIADIQRSNPGKTIQLIQIPRNQGIVNALNTGLKELKSRIDFKYIARLDAGDTCHPERFVKQVEFLNAHPEVFLLGSWCRFEKEGSGRGFDYITQTEQEKILKEMHYKCSFIHPTVMFRNEVLETIGFYPENYAHTEDFAYFWQILKTYKTAILPQILLFVHLSDKTISSRNYKQQLRGKIKVIRNFGTYRLHKFLGIISQVCRLLMPGKLIQTLKLR